MLDRLAAILNRGLADSTRARELAKALEGRKLRLQLTSAPRSLQVTIRDGVVELSSADTVATDASVTGGALALFKLVTAAPESAANVDGVRVAGDYTIAQQFILLAQLLRPDVEHELSRLVGLGPAQLMLGSVRSASSWLRNWLGRSTASGVEYLAHEKRWLVPGGESEHRQHETDSLKLEVQRLERRVSALAARLGESGRNGVNEGGLSDQGTP